MKICVVGASGKLGKYLVGHALGRGYEVVGVCRERSVGKLDAFKGRITIIPGQTNDRKIIKKAVEGCDGVLSVLAPWGVQKYASGTAQAVLDFAPTNARLIFSCGWHITRDGKDVYSRAFKWMLSIVGWLMKLLRVVEIDDQVKHADESLRATRDGRLFGEAISKKAQARDFPCGATMLATLFWQATSRGAWISRFL